MGKEPEGVQSVIDGDDDDVWRLVDPVFEGPVTRVTVDIP